MITAGIDAGSRSIKIILWDTESRRILASGICDQGIYQKDHTLQLLNNMLQEQGIERNQIVKIIATGYGRNLVEFADETITEITCHARGVFHEIPTARTIVEIGGQDSKLIRINEKGVVQDFAMNDRCAAGTGCFLEMVARRLNIPVQSLGDLARRSQKPAIISSMCVVFAETEIIGLLASSVPPENIIAGVQAAVAERLASMAGRRIESPVYFTGGVALISGMAEALTEALGRPVEIAPAPQYTGALGAALLATLE